MMEKPIKDRERKLEAVRAAVEHNFPTADIDEMLDQIAQDHRPSAQGD